MMTRRLAYAFTCFALLTLMGCAAQRHMDAGDAAAAGGDMRGALHHYQRAMGHKQSLARDPAFTQKLATAESRVAYADATHLRDRGQFERAIEKLHVSIERDPSYEPAKELMPAVRAEAAHWRYGRALLAADGGDLAGARQELERALRHDLTHEGAASAMASLSPEQLVAGTAGLAEHATGVKLSAERRWALAEQAWAESVGRNRNLLPARAGLHRARQALAESRERTSQGQARLNEQRLGPAMDQFSLALSVWPFNEPAQSGLSASQAQRQQADERFAAANIDAEARRWDDAIAQTDAGLRIDRSHQGLRELKSQLPRRAAADFSEQGDNLRRAGGLEAARDAYDQALGYANHYPEALQGMANVYRAWAGEDEADRRLGSALLHYAKARGYQDDRSLEDAYGRVLDGLHARHAMGMGLLVQQNHNASGLVQDALLGVLSKHRGEGLALEADRPPYVLDVVISVVDIDQRLTATAHREHAYTTRDWRHNPEYDRVARRLDREIATLDRYCRDYERAVGRGHHGHQAGGHDAHADQLYNRISRQQRSVSRWKEQLSCTPRRIQVSVRRAWPYTIETHTKLGRMSAVVSLIDSASGQIIQRYQPDVSYSASDDYTVNANPAVGLGPDELNLPSDGHARRALANRLAESVADEALNRAVQHRLAAIGQQATTLREEDEDATALEREVDAATLLHMVDPEAAAKLLGDLTAQHTR